MANSDVLFQRQITVAFGLPGQMGNAYDGLRVTFELELSNFSTPNKGKIKVYNLTEASRGLTQKKGLYLILAAGYGETSEKLPIIFSGDIYKSYSEIEGPSIATVFELGNGMTAYQASRTDASFSPGAAISQVFNTVLKSFGKPVGDTSAIGTGTFLNGVSLSGHSRDHMDYLCNKQGLEWSIQDDVIKVVKKGKATSETAVLLTAQTGLIGLPKKKDRGIEFKCLLNPQVRPLRAVQIKTKEISGNFRCDVVKIKGDNFGKDFMCEVEARPL